MTPLPPAPTFNRESVVPATTDGPVAAAAAPLSGAAAGLPIPTGYVLVKRETLVMLQREFQRLKREQLDRDLPPAFLRSPAPVFPDIRTRA